MALLILRGDMWYSDMRVDGRRIRHALSRFKPEAKAMLKEMIEVRRAQKRGDIVRNMSWGNFRDTYLKASRAEKNMKTFYHDRHAFQLADETTHLTTVAQMTPDRLARIKVALIEGKKVSPSAIARGIRGMITAMRWAEDRKYVAMQNWRTVKYKEPAGRKDYYEAQAYLSLLSKLEGDWFTSALIMGRAGLRLGEVLHLEWQDIKFESRQIVFRSKPHLGWKIKKDDKLTKVRVIPILFSDLWTHLQDVRQPSGFVLSDKVSRREDVYGRQLTRALEATEIKTHGQRLGHPHLLRHTFGSHLAQIGITLKKIASWMGHESQRMTEGYSHLCPEDNGNDIGIVEKLGSGLVPVHNSIPSPMVLLGTSGQGHDTFNLSSESR